MNDLDTELIYVASISMLLVTSLIVSIKKSGNNPLVRGFLTIYFWAFFYAALISYIVLYKYITYVPHLFRTTFLTWSLVLPCSYMYLLQTLYPRRLKVSDLIHLLPFLLYLVDYFPFFLLPASEKMNLMEKMTAAELRTGFNEGWFMPKHGYHLIRVSQILLYCFAQLFLIIKVSRSANHPLTVENPVQFNWLKFLVGSQFLMLLGPLIAAIFFKGPDTGIYTNLAALLVSIIQCYFLVFHPEVLYGTFFDYSYAPEIDNKNAIEPLVIYDQEPETITAEKVSGPKPVKVLDEEGDILESFVNNRQPFLQPGYKLTDMAADTGIGVHKISAYINNRHQMNFYNFLNKRRIDQCLKKMSADEHLVKTLEALALECGFNSRSTFIRAFKSITGFTPTEYLEKNNNQQTGN